MGFSIDGIVTGFDTTAVIDGLLQFQEKQISLHDIKKLDLTTKQTAFNGIEAQILTMRSSMSRLNRSVGSVFDVHSATSTDEDIIKAAAGGKAGNATYSLTVNSLAAAEQLGSQGFASETSNVDTGSYSLRVGNGTVSTIQIDGTNNTLQGFVDAVNDTVDDISASLVFDQSGDSYRILLSSNVSGASNTISVTSVVDGIDVEPDFSGPAVQAAADASVTLGSGPGAITAEYSTNQVEGLINDVTLDLVSADAGKQVTVTVSNDNEPAKEAIGKFVDDFNGIMSFIDSQTAFDPGTEQASPLLGNRNVSSIQDSLRNFVIETVDGLDTSINRLSTIGIKIDTHGKLQLDESQLDKALKGQIEGLDPKEIPKLFGLQAESDNAGIQFVIGSNRTVASTTPYQVDIIQAAEQANVEGTNTIAASTVIDGTNNEFQIKVNGAESETLYLEQGTYTRDELASHLQSVINGSSDLQANDVSVEINSDKISITTQTYGLKSSIQDISGSAITDLGFDGSEIDYGQDVAGTFVVDGVTEAAVGNGQILVGDSENANTADLQLKITLTSAEVIGGVEGEVTVTRGVSSRLDKYMGEILNESDGKLQNIKDEFDAQIASIDESIDRIREITDQKRQYLVQEFAKLESLINDLKTTGNFLAAQFGNTQKQ